MSGDDRQVGCPERCGYADPAIWFGTQSESECRPAKGYFWPVKPPTPEELDTIAHKIAKRVSRYLEQTGYLYRDAESEYLDLVHDEDDARFLSFFCCILADVR